jgi:hypothetical protein
MVDEEEEEGVAKDAEQKTSLQKDPPVVIEESRESKSHDSKSR